MKLKTDFYFIHALTNLHAGSGQTTYGIVDKEVQRDPVDKIPVIHASSLKGAYREQLTGLERGKLEKIFGSDNSARNSKNEDFQAGSYFFFEAKLCVLPLRSNYKPFYRAVCPYVFNEISDKMQNFGYEVSFDSLKEALDFLKQSKPKKGIPIVYDDRAEKGKIRIEDFDDIQIETPVPSGYEYAKSLFGDDLVVLHDEDFKTFCKKLPVIARNKLVNGLSENLFYEEVVPRESIFYSFLIRPESDDDFWHCIKNDLGYRVQIGANATIGYGQCNLIRY